MLIEFKQEFSKCFPSWLIVWPWTAPVQQDTADTHNRPPRDTAALQSCHSPEPSDSYRQEAFCQSIILNSDPNAKHGMKVLLTKTHIYCEKDKSWAAKVVLHHLQCIRLWTYDLKKTKKKNTISHISRQGQDHRGPTRTQNTPKHSCCQTLTGK